MNTTDYSSRWHSLSARGCVPAHICKQCSKNTGRLTGLSWSESELAQWLCERLQEPFRHQINRPVWASGPGHDHMKLGNDHHRACERDGAADELSECLHDVLPSLSKENIDGAAFAIARGLAIFMRGIGKTWANENLPQPWTA